jgi:MFS family permease
LRIAGGTSGILIGLYLASLSNTGAPIGAGIVGSLGAVSFAAELLASIPMGMAADALQPRWLMSGGAVLGALAVQLFALTGSTAVFFGSRILEGIGAAAIVPALLAYLADETEGRTALRVRVMSYFELTLLAGLALGGIVAAQLFRALHAGAFTVVAVIYVACAAVLFASVARPTTRHIAKPIAHLRELFRLPSLPHLAPVWVCVNAIVGLWLGPTLPFLLTQRSTSAQFLAGIYAANPARVGWLLFAYAIVFGIGITVWSVVLPHVRLRHAMRITLGAILPACATIYVLNHSAHVPVSVRWIAGGILTLVVMVESGFTPAALAWLAQTLPVQSGRAAAMGMYSVLLSVGEIVGSLLAAVLGQRFAIDGLLAGTVLMTLVALIFLYRAPSLKSSDTGANA